MQRLRGWIGGGFGRLRRAHLSVRLVLGGIVGLLILFFLVFLIEYRIDDDPNLAPNPSFVVANGSNAVTMASTLMDLEINHTGWAPNRLWYHPIAYSANMKNYQRGIQYAVARWAVEMADVLGRERGSGEADSDLGNAAGLFKYDPSAWIFPSAVTQYQKGIQSLNSYNRRLGAGQAKYDKIASNLAVFLDRISKDLGSQSASLELTVLSPEDYSPEEKQRLNDSERAALSSNGGYFDSRATAAFYATKGRLYAYYLLLKAIGEDYHDAIATKNATEHWDNMLVSLRSGASFSKFFIANGQAGDYFIPSDLSTQGFHLLRADKQLQELADIMNK
ncbi:MAG TPA: DUF2333 family protein [Aliidongia sp.]|nr:DUF2333 family protein [Aliidongia sp.]